MAEILIVDDERVIREGLKATLQGEGFSVRTARDGEDALRKISEQRPDLVLLDVMMPKMNGFCVCEEIRRTEKLLPVVFLTAKDSEADQVRGLGLGADDYVSKDAGEAVLLARICRALQRADLVDKKIESCTAAAIRLGRVTVDTKALEISDARGVIGHLTKTEAGILKLLDTARGRYFTVEEIVENLRGKGFACEDGIVYSHVYNLRQKLGPVADLLTSSRHGGYCLLK